MRVSSTTLGTVIALGLLFSPFTYKTVVFVVVTAIVLVLLPHLTTWLTRLYAYRTAAIRTKWVMLVLFGLGALALWSGSESVLPAYIVGMVLAGHASRDAFWIRRLRTLTVGFLTPFYFLRAGMLVSVTALVSAPVRLFRAVRRQGPFENLRSLSGHPAVQTRSQRAVVLYPHDVHRVDVRYDLGALRFVSRHCDAGSILLSGSRGHRERGHTDTDCGVRFSARTSPARARRADRDRT